MKNGETLLGYPVVQTDGLPPASGITFGKPLEHYATFEMTIHQLRQLLAAFLKYTSEAETTSPTIIDEFLESIRVEMSGVRGQYF